jgi:hypothetical protein
MKNKEQEKKWFLLKKLSLYGRIHFCKKKIYVHHFIIFDELLHLNFHIEIPLKSGSIPKSSPSRSWVDDTTTTEEEREVWKTHLEIAGRRRDQSLRGFRPDHSAFLGHMNEETGMLLRCRASLSLLAETRKNVLCFFFCLNCVSSGVNRSERVHL